MSFRENYFKTLKIDPAFEKDKVKAALDRAYTQRSFEIEHYWKRATYFWGFQIAVFATFGLVWKEPAGEGGRFLLIALSVVGFLTAVANSLSAEGSKFWQQNWENHIDMLEDEIEGKLYKTAWLKGGRTSFSVSKVNGALNLCFLGFWLFALFYVTWRFLVAQSLIAKLETVRIEWLVVPFIVAALGVVFLWRSSAMRGTVTNSEGIGAEKWTGSCPFEKQSVLCRFPPNVKDSNGSA